VDPHRKEHSSLRRKNAKAEVESAYKKKREARLQPSCGAKTRAGGQCAQPAGWGTNHMGTGKCRFHAGNAPNHRKNAIKAEAITFMGAPLDINPFDAIMWCIRITAGEVEWMSMKIAEVDEVDWIEEAYVGKQLHVLQRSRADAQDRLVRYSRDAIQLGLAERSIRLAENFGLVLARLLENIKNELKLTKSQEEMWPFIVRRQLILMQGGTPPPDVIEGEAVDADALTA
jgi:hypothetical protein